MQDLYLFLRYWEELKDPRLYKGEDHVVFWKGGGQHEFSKKASV